MCLRRRILMMNHTIDEHSMFEMLDAAQVESRRRAAETGQVPKADVRLADLNEAALRRTLRVRRAEQGCLLVEISLCGVATVG